MFKLISLCIFAFTVSSCAIRPQFEQTCGFPKIDLETDQPPDNISFARTEAAGQSSEPSYVEILDTSLKNTARTSIEPARLLFLSGGGQHGAFGAGFLAEWGARSPGGKLPKFDVVTGISTGAILSTWAFLGDGDQAASRYHIENESRLLKPYVKIRNGKMTTGSYINLLRKGAIADLAPLRNELRQAFTDDILEAVATAAPDRRLLVGAVDVDSGRAVAFDLKEMAERFHRVSRQNPKFAVERERFRNCYAEAVLASSSAPLAARPVFIDNRMYVDGGLRFGVFDAALSAALARQTASRRNAPPQIYMIINGSQDVAPLCPQSATTMECNTVADPRRRQKNRHASWNFPDLALRSQDILANQIYRFSAADVANRNQVAFPGADNLRFARIYNPDLQGFTYKPDGAPDAERKSCMAWRKHDADTLNPVQFYPNYMDCVSAYGRSRARQLAWFGTSPTSD
jgi:predicted patatin/cPLA2 family phospholipase